MKLRLIVGILGVVLVGGALAQEEEDPFAGKWKLNVAKSQLAKPLKSGAMTLQVGIDPAEFPRSIEKMDLEIEDAQGVREIISYSARYTGPGDFDIVDGLTRAPIGQEAALRSIDPNTREFSRLRNRKPIAVARRVLSADKKTLTVTVKSAGSAGVEIQEVQIWERQ